MAIAGLICPKDKIKEVTEDIRRIKEKHGISINSEIKWTKISTAKRLLYLDLVELFFSREFLEFRIVLIKKDSLKDKTHFDEFYNKMCYLLLRYMMRPYTINYIYLDKKDTRGYERINILRDCLDKIRDRYDMKSNYVKNIQNVQSREVEIMQILDILIGAMVYHARGLNKVTAKVEIIDYIKDKTGLSLEKNTPLSNHKFNILYYKPGSNEEL